jgi:hypothetical protein
MGVDRRPLLWCGRGRMRAFFHFQSFPASMEIHHAFFFFELVFHFTHFFLNVRVARGDREALLDHSDAEYEEEDGGLRYRAQRDVKDKLTSRIEAVSRTVY